MYKYFELTIVKTAKKMGRTEIGDWETYDTEVKTFATLKEVKAYLKEQYFYLKTKYPMFRDIKGKSVKIGYIYAFKSAPVSYDDVKHYEQHWVEVVAVERTDKPVVV